MNQDQANLHGLRSFHMRSDVARLIQNLRTPWWMDRREKCRSGQLNGSQTKLAWKTVKFAFVNVGGRKLIYQVQGTVDIQ